MFTDKPNTSALGSDADEAITLVREGCARPKSRQWRRHPLSARPDRPLRPRKGLVASTLNCDYEVRFPRRGVRGRMPKAIAGDARSRGPHHQGEAKRFVTAGFGMLRGCWRCWCSSSRARRFKARDAQRAGSRPHASVARSAPLKHPAGKAAAKKKAGPPRQSKANRAAAQTS